MILALLNAVELSAIAFMMCRFPTSVGTTDWRTGMSNADANPDMQREHHHVPDRHDSERRQQAEYERGHHQDRLRAEEQSAAIDPVRQHAGQQCEERHRQRADEADGAEHEGGMSQIVDEPSLRGVLHPATDCGQEFPVQ